MREESPLACRFVSLFKERFEVARIIANRRLARGGERSYDSRGNQRGRNSRDEKS